MPPAPAPETDHPLPIEKGRSPATAARGWDPSLRSPIFFGYLDVGPGHRDKDSEAFSGSEQSRGDEVAERKRESAGRPSTSLEKIPNRKSF